MILETIPDVNRLTPAQKLLLVSELWDDLAAHPTEVPVSREQIAFCAARNTHGVASGQIDLMLERMEKPRDEIKTIIHSIEDW